MMTFEQLMAMYLDIVDGDRRGLLGTHDEYNIGMHMYGLLLTLN